MVAIPEPGRYTRVPFVNQEGKLTTDGVQFLQLLYNSIGGPAAGEVQVQGPSSSTDNAIPRWNGTSGSVLRDSDVTLDGAGNIAGVGDLGADSATLTSLTVGGSTVSAFPQVGEFRAFTTTIGQADLAAGGSVTMLDAATNEQWYVREILLSGDGTNFSGGGGDRLLAISDGTSTWSVVPAATLQSLTAARWGDTGAPFPATASHLTTASAASADIVAAYSGGSADYSAGSCTIVLIAERAA